MDRCGCASCAKLWGLESQHGPTSLGSRLEVELLKQSNHFTTESGALSNVNDMVVVNGSKSFEFRVSWRMLDPFAGRDGHGTCTTLPHCPGLCLVQCSASLDSGGGFRNRRYIPMGKKICSFRCGRPVAWLKPTHLWSQE